MDHATVVGETVWRNRRLTLRVEVVDALLETAELDAAVEEGNLRRQKER
jgi:hypothetical protein